MADQATIRYRRQEVLKEIGLEGQEKLLKSKVLILGVGGLGCPVALYLAAAGVGHIGLVDSDHVSVSNLQRQVLFGEEDIGLNKAIVGVSKLSKDYPHLHFTAYDLKLNAHNALTIIEEYDLVFDCTDNFPSKYLLSDACEILRKPWVHASVHQWEGQISLFLYRGSANYRDLYPEAPLAQNAPNCNTAGVLGALVGLVGSIQALEGIKALLNIEPNLANTLLCIESKTMFVTRLKYKRIKDRIAPRDLIDYDHFCNYTSEMALDPQRFSAIKKDSYYLIDVRGPQEHDIFNLGGKNIEDEEEILNFITTNTSKSTLILYCSAGIRSRKVAENLKKKVFDKDIFYLNGPIEDFE